MRMLSPKEVAEELGIDLRVARQIIMELPNVNLSREVDSKKPRYAISQAVFEGFVSGRIKRTPVKKEVPERRRVKRKQPKEEGAKYAANGEKLIPMRKA